MDFDSIFGFEVDYDVAIERELEAVVRTPHCIVIHNDDFHTFDFVIETLIEVCGHDSIQAEQCTFVIHYSGKCAVKTDMFKRLQPYWAEITRRGLTATIEKLPQFA